MSWTQEPEQCHMWGKVRELSSTAGCDPRVSPEAARSSGDEVLSDPCRMG